MQTKISFAAPPISVWRDPSEELDASTYRDLADCDGSYRCDELLPGVDYNLFVDSGLGDIMDVATQKNTTTGQELDLGDVLAKPYQ